MNKPSIEIKERENYDIIMLEFKNGARITITTNNSGFLVNNSALCDVTMYIKPSMGNAFEVMTGALNDGKA